MLFLRLLHIWGKNLRWNCRLHFRNFFEINCGNFIFGNAISIVFFFFYLIKDLHKPKHLYKCRYSNIFSDNLDLCRNYDEACKNSFQCTDINCPRGDDVLQEVCHSNFHCPKECKCWNPSEMVCKNGKIEFLKLPKKYYLKSLRVENVNGDEILEMLIKIKEVYITYLNILNSNLTEKTLFLPFPNLKYLNLSLNSIKILKKVHLSKLHFLEILIFNDNNFKSINENAFGNLKNLRELILKNCRIYSIKKNIFLNSNKLKKLKIINSRIFSIEDNFLRYLNKLEEIDFFKSDLNEKTVISYLNFKLNKNLKFLKSNYFKLCCFLKKNIQSSKICWPNKSEFFSCESLIGSLSRKFILHIIVLIGISGNVYLIFKKISIKLKPINIIELLLMISEFKLFLFFLSLIIIDWKFYENYIEHDFEWRSSFYCKILEFIASTSCILSNFSLLLITWERYLGIKYLTTTTNKQKFSQIILLVCLTIILSLILSILPFLIFKVYFLKKNGDFTKNSGENHF